MVGISGGIIGSILLFMAFFTGHYYIHNNWNLIMLNPLMFNLFIGGILQLTERGRINGKRIVDLYFNITFIAIMILIIIKITGIVDQENGEIIALVAPTIAMNTTIIKKLIRAC